MPSTRSLSAFLGIAVLAYVWHQAPALSDSQYLAIAGTAAAVAATLLGFSVACLSILTTVANRRMILNMRKTGHYQVLLDELYLSAAGFFASLVMSLIALGVSGRMRDVSLPLLAALGTFSLAMFCAAGRKFYLVMARVGDV